LDATAKPTRDDLRGRLLEEAARLLEESGPEALQARTLTAGVGVSTQALYTLFGGMPGLFEALVADGFRRLDEDVAAVPLSDDPVTDFFAQGRIYGRWALGNPQLYRLMFGHTGGGLRRHAGLEMNVTGAVAGSPEAQRAIDFMVRSMDRIVASGRIDPVDPALASVQFLSATHGWVLLSISGVFDPGDAPEVARSFGVNLMVGLGDDPDAAARSMRAVEQA
jgi:AcrR family transcriptional regulator